MTNATVAVWTPPKVVFGAKDLQNIRDLYAKDSEPNEFQRFIRVCEVRGLDPRLGHAFCFIFNADDKAKAKGKQRQAITVISESGYLTAADRIRDGAGNHIYLADDQVPVYTYDEKLKNAKTNPLGLESATVAVKKFAQGQWHRIPAQVFWDERAPIGEEWQYDIEQGKSVKTGELALDKSKQGWIKQPRNMLAKCARVAACRYAFPDQMGGLYSEEEIHAIQRGQLQVIDLTPDEIIAQREQAEHLKAIGADKAIPLILDPAKGIEYVPLGQVHDQIEAAFRANPDAAEIERFVVANRVGIKEFMTLQGKGEWLDLRERYIDAAAEEMSRRKKEAEKGNEQIPVDKSSGK